MGILSKANQIQDKAAEKAPVQPTTPTPPKPAAPTVKAEAAHDVGTELEKVRDLLFGTQLREQQETVEHRLEESIEELRTTVDRKVQSFQDSVTAKLEKQAAHLETEATQRLSGFNVLEEKLTRQQETLDAKIAEHREWVETTIKAFEDRAEKRDEAVRHELGTKLRDDRKHFAKLLGELSAQLAD